MNERYRRTSNRHTGRVRNVRSFCVGYLYVSYPLTPTLQYTVYPVSTPALVDVLRIVILGIHVVTTAI